MPTLYKTVNTGAQIPRDTGTSLMVAFLMLLYGFNGAIGSNLDLGWYYLVPAVSWIDIVVFIHFLLIINWRSERLSISTLNIEKILAYGLFIFASLLIISTSLNAFRFNSSLSDLLPPIKLIYFIVLIHVIRKSVERFGVYYLINGFFLGVTVFVLQSLAKATVASSGLPILYDPNTTGASISQGVFFAAMMIKLERKIFLPLLFATLFLGFSAMTWSKGTWIMCLLGVFLIILFLFDHFRQQEKISISSSVIVSLFVLLMAYVFVINIESIVGVFEHKMASTENIDSVGMRVNLLLASVYGGLQNPLGVGYRNFYQVQQYAMGLGLPAMTSGWNAHNAFFQILAVGGPLAFLLLMGLFICPFLALKRVLLKIDGINLQTYLAVLLSFGIWLIYGSVQLQLIAQPGFWFFCGLIFGVVGSGRSLVLKNA